MPNAVCRRSNNSNKRTSETPLIIRREAALVELLLAGRVPRLSLLTLSRSAGLLFS